MIADGERLTFARAERRSRPRLARALAGGCGIGKGDRVAIAMRNCPAWIVAYMAVAEGGRDRRRWSTAGGRRTSFATALR